MKAQPAPRRRPNSSRRLRPGISPGNTERVPAQASPQASTRKKARTGLGLASPLPQPVLRCKRRSQLPQNRTPVRPHVLHSLPRGYGEGDLNAIANGGNPSAGDALGTPEQTTGQNQSRSLVNAQPVPFHEFYPADHRAEGRVHLMDSHTFAVALRDRKQAWVLP